MKKIIFMLLLTTSVMLLAKNERPIKKAELKKETKTILIVKKTIEEEKVKVKEIKKISKEGMNLEGCMAIASYVGSYDPPLGAAMMGECVRNYN